MVVDPVDGKRNVAAALTMQKMADFVVAASHYLENPSQDFFFKKKEEVDLDQA